MGNDPTILYVVLGLVAIVYLVLGVLSFKTWRVLHALTAMAIFLATGYYIVVAAAYLKTDAVWRGQEHDPLKAEVDELHARLAELKGESPFEDYEFSKSRLSAEIARELLKRGRVWRSVVPGAFDGQSVTADMSRWGNDRCITIGINSEPALDDDAVEGESTQQSAGPHFIEENMVLYAFVETPIKDLGEDEEGPNLIQRALFGESDLVINDTQGYCKVPTFFLGEFRVTNAEVDRITLIMTTPPDARQLAMLGDQNVTSWVLYDAMPIDGHDVFVDASRDEPLVAMSEEEIRALVPPSLGSDEAAREHYENLIHQLLRDGQEANDTDDPTNVNTLVRMITNPNPSGEDQAVLDAFSAVDAPRREGDEEPFNFETPLYFDENGLAVAPSIVQGSPTLADSGRELLLDNQTAQNLIDHGWAEETGKVYVRPLRSFSLASENYYAQMRRLEDRITAVRNDTARLVEANRVGLAIVEERNQEQVRLDHDWDGFAIELAAIGSHVEKLEALKEIALIRIQTLATLNRNQAARLVELTAQIESAARAADTPSPDESASTGPPSS